jgi:nitrile hydratase
MNGAHDMGGMHGFGPVVPEPNEPVFHAEWERRIFALTMAMGFTGQWTIDMSRQARESQHPAAYLAESYYEVWLAGLERLLAERDLVGPEEIASSHALRPRRPVKRVAAADVETLLAKGSPYDRAPPAPARFAVGDRVRAKNINPPTHTRIPRYVRGHLGTIAQVRGCHVFPDTSARGEPEQPHWLYSVRFDGRELWGAESDPSLKVFVEMWEPYLEPA